jgi:hypothetical protein
MTAQIPDIVVFEGREYSIAGVKGSGLFHPADHGLFPRATSTANWRGFVCRYVVDEGRLTLDRVAIGLDEAADLFGHAPRRDERSASYLFEQLARPVPFTGRLLLGEGFIQNLYVHMGFHPAWKFEHVEELAFEDGGLTEATDLSEAAQRFRLSVAAGELRPSVGSGHMEHWIEDTFSLHYDPEVPFRPPIDSSDKPVQ